MLLAEINTTTVFYSSSNYFADTRTKFKIHQIYYSHYTGSPLWNLTGTEVVQFGLLYQELGDQVSVLLKIVSMTQEE